jgi:hypothetical protein
VLKNFEGAQVIGAVMRPRNASENKNAHKPKLVGVFDESW